MLTNGKLSARIGNAVGTAGVAQLVEQLICNQQAGGSSPSTSSTSSSLYLGEFQSGQMGQTVNLLSLTSVVRIHLPPPAQKFPLPLRFPPEGRKASPDGEFLRFHLRTALLGSQVIFLRGTRDGGFFVGPDRLVRPFLFRVSGSYKKLGGKLKIAHMFDYVKGKFTRFL